MNLKDRIQKKNTGERIELKTFSDLWVVPKKFTVAQEDELQEIHNQVVVKNPKMVKLVSKFKDLKNLDSEDFSTFMENATDEELKCIYLANNSLGVGYTKKLIRYGISKNNLCDDEEKGIKDSEYLSEEVIDIILEDSDLTMELVNIVHDFNNSVLTKETSEIVSPGV